MSNKQIYIGIASDGFSIEYDGKRYCVNQEDDPSVELTKLFESMGLSVELGEEY